ncbi:site-specific recombinase, DNA invertase Pin (plasmid) [Mycobacterium sp. JS623]|uniref:recombinase family protein n=1 Tax=Mycobacterium sp. JS623 TaxID=212767 RepID=UPI0002A56EC9|nr:recombinase family protein [Mycobacterium sp. JS623]AGB26955.1 site-specific recombinase, DNA invertase Pin [Mycobacterium sp. JS623]
MEAAVYLRQSVDKYGDELAITRQREDCLKLCGARAWIPHEYVDNDRSATKGPRPAYEQMLDDIRTGVIGAVVVWDLDRLHRRPMELEHFIDLADDKHLALASVGGDADLSTDNGRLFARIKGAVSRAEIERKSARQKRAARQRAEAGIWWIGPRPFGYTEAGEVVDTEAGALREAYSAILASASLYSIAAQWNSAGIKTTRGNAWTGRSVKQTLVRPRYAGFRFYRDEILGKADWPAIVPEALWRAVRDILADPSRRAPWTGRKYLLTGLARCGKCGATVTTTTKAQVGRVVYVCKHCYGISRKQAEVDNWVIWRVANALAQPDAWRALLGGTSEDAALLREEQAALRSRLDMLATDFADGVLTRDQLRTATERIRRRLADVESQMFGPDAHRYFGDVIDADDPRVAFRELPLDRKRALIETMATVTIMPIGHGGTKVFDPLMVEILPRNGFVCRP